MGLKIRSLGLNSYEFVTEGGVRIVADPTFSRPWKKTPVERDTYPPPDIIFLTHGDPSDHVFEVPRLLNETDAICVASPVVCEYLAGMGGGNDIPGERLMPVEWNERVQIQGVELLITKALHVPLRWTITIFTGKKRMVDVDAPVEMSDSATKIFMDEIPSYKDRVKAVREIFGDHLPPRGPCIGFHLTTETGHTLWYSGSYLRTADTEVLARAIRPQIALMQLIMTKEKEAARVAGILKPAIAIPFHQDKNFDDQPGDEADTDLFAREVEKLSPLSRTVVPEIGEWYDVTLELTSEED